MRNRKLNRLNGWDYSKKGWYYVTICVDDRECVLGDVVDGKMTLSEIGLEVCDKLDWLVARFQYLTIDVLVIMPNHIHAVMVIDFDRERSRPFPTNNKIKSISELIGAFKTTSSKQIHVMGYKSFKWQKSFHDHIVRNENELEKIRWYIQKNPEMWERDRNNG